MTPQEAERIHRTMEDRVGPSPESYNIPIPDHVINYVAARVMYAGLDPLFQEWVDAQAQYYIADCKVSYEDAFSVAVEDGWIWALDHVGKWGAK